KLREMKTDNNLLLFKIKLEPGGHGGASGGYDPLRDMGVGYALIPGPVGGTKGIGGGGGWGRRDNVIPPSPFPIPHSLFAYFPSTSAPKNTYNLPALESSNYHIALLRTVR